MVSNLSSGVPIKNPSNAPQHGTEQAHHTQKKTERHLESHVDTPKNLQAETINLGIISLLCTTSRETQKDDYLHDEKLQRVQNIIDLCYFFLFNTNLDSDCRFHLNYYRSSIWA